ncbi:MAG: hypothetical protein HY577_00455 [Candidatus Nealsonbacteria bacterium]|nr:hypothetical protein [Candidatus Nealsonbacteria bacterium]
MKKLVFSGLLAGLVMLVVGLLANQAFGLIFTGLKAEYENPNLFRSWSDPLMSLYFLHPFLVGLILAWLWSKTKSLFRAGKCCSPGVNFGLMYWLITLPGMLISYASFPVSLLMILEWTLGGLFQAMVAGLILERMDK